MQEEKLSYSETCRRFEVNSRDQIKSWERIYLKKGRKDWLLSVVVVAVLAVQRNCPKR